MIISFPGAKLPKNYLGNLYSKWLRSLRQGNDYFKMVDPQSFYNAYHRYITNILNAHNAVVRMAVLSDDKDIVLGFCVCRGSVLDYVHVQKDFRMIGMATKLVPEDIDTVTHLTRTALSIWGSKYSHWKFNPFAEV